MVYTGNPSTSTTDAVRLLIYDVSTSSGLNALTDVEITYFLNTEVNTLYAAAAAAETISSKGSNFITSKSVGDLEEQTGGSGTISPSVMYRELADKLRMRANLSLKPFSGGISVSDKRTQEADTDWDKPAVRIGIHDNPGSASSSTRF